MKRGSKVPAPPPAGGAPVGMIWLLGVLLAGLAAFMLFGRFALESGSPDEPKPAAPQVIERPPLRITDPRIRQPLPGTTRTAAYFTVENLSSDPLVLLAVDSPLLQRIEIHETVQIGDRVRMERLARLSIPAGGSVILEPGGRHLMIFGVTERLPEEVPLTFRLMSGKDYVIPFRSYGISET